VLPANYSVPASTLQSFTRWRLPRLRLRTSNCSLLLIYLSRKNEVSMSWLTYSRRFTQISCHRQLQVECRTGKVCQSRTNILPLNHANNQVSKLVSLDIYIRRQNREDVSVVPGGREQMRLQCKKKGAYSSS